MKKGERMSSTPGFQYDGRTKTAFFDLTIPGEGRTARRRKTVKGLDRVAAQAAWATFRDEILSPKPAVEVLTLKAYVEKHWKDIVLTVTPRTRRGYETHLNHLILPELGGLELQKVNAAAVRDFVGRMKVGLNTVPGGKAREGGYSPNTIKHCLAILRRILRDAVDREDLVAYPIKGKLPRLKAEPLKLEFSEEERARFLTVFEDEAVFRAFWHARHLEDERKRNEKPVGARRPGGVWAPESVLVADHFLRFRASRPFFVVALETGLRLGDLVALAWSSVDLKAGFIRVRMSKTKEEAVIPISEELAAAFQSLRFRKDDTGRVFSSGGATWSWTVLHRYFVMAKKLAGIDRRFRFHDCRHTFASRMASAGVSLQVIAKMLGHTTVQMSQRYARPDEAALKAALAMVKASRIDARIDASAPRADRGAV